MHRSNVFNRVVDTIVRVCGIVDKDWITEATELALDLRIEAEYLDSFVDCIESEFSLNSANPEHLNWFRVGDVVDTVMRMKGK